MTGLIRRVARVFDDVVLPLGVHGERRSARSRRARSPRFAPLARGVLSGEQEELNLLEPRANFVMKRELLVGVPVGLERFACVRK
jgi:hypothetical protein